MHICVLMCTEEAVCVSLTCLNNHHTGVKKGDGQQLPGTVRHSQGRGALSIAGVWP